MHCMHSSEQCFPFYAFCCSAPHPLPSTMHNHSSNSPGPVRAHCSIPIIKTVFIHSTILGGAEVINQ